MRARSGVRRQARGPKSASSLMKKVPPAAHFSRGPFAGVPSPTLFGPDFQRPRLNPGPF